MSIRAIESMAAGAYCLPDKPFRYVQDRVMKTYDRADQFRDAIDTPEAFLSYQAHIREALRAIWGKLPYDRDYPLNAQITGEIVEEELTCKKVIFTSRENVYVTGNLYIPHKREHKCPGVLLQSGHSENGKAVAAYQRAARTIALGGCIVLATDPPGQGERVSYVNEAGEKIVMGATPNHQLFATQCFLMGDNPASYFLADAMRSVDYLCSLPEVDETRIGATGNSGGGTMTVMLMGVDDRIQAAAPSCWPCAGRDYFPVGTSPDGEQILQNIIKSGLDHYELLASFCPKPVILLSAEYDFIPIEGTRRLHAGCKRLWDVMGAGDDMQIFTAEHSHGYSKEQAQAASRFFQRCFGLAETPPAESVQTLPDAQIQCTKSGQVRLDFPDSLSIFQETQRKFRHFRDNPPSIEETRAFLYGRVYNGRSEDVCFRLKPTSSCWDDGLFVEAFTWFTQESMPCYGVLFKSAENKNRTLPVTICLWQNGTNALCANAHKIRSLCRAGRAVFVPDLTGMGKGTPFNMRPANQDPQLYLSSILDKINKSLFTLGDSLCALRVYDLMQTMRMMRNDWGVAEISLFAREKYCVYGRIAQAIEPELPVEYAEEVRLADILDNEYYDTYDLPAITMPGLGKYLD